MSNEVVLGKEAVVLVLKEIKDDEWVFHPVKKTTVETTETRVKNNKVSVTAPVDSKNSWWNTPAGIKRRQEMVRWNRIRNAKKHKNSNADVDSPVDNRGVFTFETTDGQKVAYSKPFYTIA